VFNRVETAPMPFFVRPIAIGIAQKVKRGFINPNLERLVAYIDDELGRGEWFTGATFTAADIQMSFPVQAIAARAGGAEKANIARFVARIEARPAYKRALEKGGEFAILR
jgi:glutathione S-transferase